MTKGRRLLRPLAIAMGGLLVASIVVTRNQAEDTQVLGNTETPSPSSPRRVIDRSETTVTYENHDRRTRTTHFFNRAVNFKDSTGAWKPIDTTLEGDSTGDGYRNRSGPAKVHFARRTGESHLVAVERGDWSLDFNLMDVETGKAGRNKGSAITYADVLPEVDLSFRVLSSSLKEELILKRPPETADDQSYVYPVRLRNVDAIEEAGGVTFISDEKRVGRIPPSSMFDGAGVEREVATNLVDTADGAAVQLTVDGTWLTEEKREYPVRIDPSLILTIPRTTRWRRH